MSTQNVIIGAIVVLVLIGGGWYLYSRTPAGQPSLSATSTVETAGAATAESGSAGDTTPPGKGTGPLQNVFNRGGNYTCTFGTASTVAGTGAQSSGTIYASGGTTRGDFSIMSNTGARTTVHVIRTGSLNYTWIDGQTSGTKTPVTAATASRINPSGAGFTEDQFASVTWDCHPWLTDATQFAPPKSISFVLR